MPMLLVWKCRFMSYGCLQRQHSRFSDILAKKRSNFCLFLKFLCLYWEKCCKLKLVEGLQKWIDKNCPRSKQSNQLNSSLWKHTLSKLFKNKQRSVFLAQTQVITNYVGIDDHLPPPYLEEVVIWLTYKRNGDKSIKKGGEDLLFSSV